MALSTDEATFNAAVDTLMAALETLTDALAANEEIRIVWVDSKRGDLAADTHQGVDTNALFDMGRQFYWHNNPNTTNSTVLEIGGRPLFFKITNAAGDLAG
ncbi:MAG: hypothetical protein GY906_18145 [bacterium]|nr:hypothetical protein [bacterium]